MIKTIVTRRLAALLLITEATAALPQGRFTGAIWESQVGEELNPGGAVELEVGENETLRAAFPTTDPACYSNWTVAASASTNESINFTYEDAFGHCYPVNMSLSHVAGTQWRFYGTWEKPGTKWHAHGNLTFQCSTECDEGLYCNSELVEGKELGECLPLGDWYPQGTFLGELRSGTIGGPLEGDPYRAEVTFASNGITSRFGEVCGNSIPIQPLVAETGKVQFVVAADRDGCEAFGISTMDTLTHLEGNQWKLDFEWGDHWGEGILSFTCSNDCGWEGRCNSTFSQVGAIGHCDPFDSLEEQNEFWNAKNDEFNNQMICPFDSLEPVDMDENKVTTLTVYTETHETTCSLGLGCDPWGEPEVSVSSLYTLKGEQVEAIMSGCPVLPAVQLQGNQVCVSYQEHSSSAPMCKLDCIDLRSSKTIQVFEHSSSEYVYGFLFTSKTKVNCHFEVGDSEFLEQEGGTAEGTVEDTLNGENELYNDQMACPFESLDLLDPDDDQELVLNVFTETHETTCLGSACDPWGVTDETPLTPYTLHGKHVEEITEGCPGGPAVQVQEGQVCVSYEAEEREDYDASATCKLECIDFGSSAVIEVSHMEESSCPLGTCFKEKTKVLCHFQVGEGKPIDATATPIRRSPPGA